MDDFDDFTVAYLLQQIVRVTGNTILFFARTKMYHPIEFCAIIGPTETCVPKEGGESMELLSATVLLFIEGRIVESYPVERGYKYTEGGGMVEFDGRLRHIFFEPRTSGKPSIFMAETLTVEHRILIAL